MSNRGKTVAAFMCRTEVVRFLLDKGASARQKNSRGSTAIDVVSSPWSDDLATFYTGIGNAAHIKVDLERLKQDRHRIAKLLRENTEKPKQAEDETKETVE